MHWVAIREKAVLIRTVNDARSVVVIRFHFELLTRRSGSSWNLRSSGKGAYEFTCRLTLPGPECD
jgi:hypothetical protein